MRLAIAILAFCHAGNAVAQQVRFISCPIYRDTDAGKKSGCWLADDPLSGTRYDASMSAAKPDWNFAVLVEGQIAENQTDPCGGTILQPVRASVLEDRPCTRHMLPAEGYSGRKYILPKRNVDPLSTPRPAPQPPIANRTFRLFFDWNSSFIAYQREDWSLDQIFTWIRHVHVRRITVTGFGALSPAAISGQMLSEEAGISKTRAQTLMEALFRLGIPTEKIVTEDGGNGSIVEDEWVDGLSEPSRRRVDVAVEVENE